MAITVEVRGNSGGSGGGSNFNQPPQTPPSGGNSYQRIDLNQYKPGDSSSVMPSSNRIAEDIRREIQQRGIVMVPGTQNFSTMMNQMRQQQAQNLSNSIGSNYNKGIATIYDMRDKAHADVADRILNATQSALQGITNPVNIRNIQKKYSRIEEREHDRIDSFFQPFYERANQEKETAEKTSEDELTKAIQQLTQEFQRGNEGSYVNGLRNQYREAVWKRDNAGTKEEAEQFAKEAAEAQKRLGDISNVGSGGNSIMTLLRGGAGMGLAYTAIDDVVKLRNMQFQNRMTDQNLVSQTANGNIFGAIQADAERNLQNNQVIASTIGSVIGGVAGFFLGGGLPGAAAGAMGGSIAGSKIADLIGVFNGDKETIAQAQLGQILQSNEQKIMGYNSLAMMTRGGGSIDARRNALIANTYPQAAIAKQIADSFKNSKNLRDVIENVGKKSDEFSNYSSNGIFSQDSDFNLYDLGYTAPEFAQVAAQRIAARGFGATNADAAIRRAFNADAMEKVFSLGSGSLNSLAQWDRYRGTDYTQTFANLASTMNSLGARGFSNGDYGRAGEYIGYQNQLMQSQFNQGILSPNTNYATGTLATLQNVFGNALNSQAISSYNRMQSAVKNPNGDMARMVLYDVVKREFKTGNNLAAIKKVLYSQDGETQDKVNRLYIDRLKKMYGDPFNTTSGYVNFAGIFGEENPYMLEKLMTAGSKGASKVANGSVGEYAKQAKGWAAPITKSVNKISDAAMAQTAAYQDNMTYMINSMVKEFGRKLDDIISKLGN